MWDCTKFLIIHFHLQILKCFWKSCFCNKWFHVNTVEHKRLQVLRWTLVTKPTLFTSNITSVPVKIWKHPALHHQATWFVPCRQARSESHNTFNVLMLQNWQITGSKHLLHAWYEVLKFTSIKVQLSWSLCKMIHYIP